MIGPPGVHIAKYLRREVRAEFTRIAYELEFMRRVDPRGIAPELDRFRLAAVLDTTFAVDPDEDYTRDAAALLKSYSARRSMKLMKRRLRQDLCRVVEKAQLLRALDSAFDDEMRQSKLADALDTIASWHEKGDQIFLS
jgi:hypothetical protein